ncbi:MAG TPA: DedA family protein [Pirellulales bacterium]|nr:DedA family protein [Pirellulales bacterium]
MLDFLPRYLGITIPIILTGMGLPVPEEILVIAAGIASNAGTFEPLTALAACLVGAVAGDCVSYTIGYYFGRALLRDRHWFSRLLTVEREQKVEKLFQQHGLKAFLGARFLIGLRSPMYMTAGILRISFRWFLLVDAISAALVVSLFFGLSYVFAESFKHLWERFQGVEFAITVVVVLVAACAAGYFYWRWRIQKKPSGATDLAQEGTCATESAHAVVQDPQASGATETANGEAKPTAVGKTDVEEPKSVA